jgi:hypothetical protein
MSRSNPQVVRALVTAYRRRSLPPTVSSPGTPAQAFARWQGFIGYVLQEPLSWFDQHRHAYVRRRCTGPSYECITPERAHRYLTHVMRRLQAVRGLPSQAQHRGLSAHQNVGPYMAGPGLAPFLAAYPDLRRKWAALMGAMRQSQLPFCEGAACAWVTRNSDWGGGGRFRFDGSPMSDALMDTIETRKRQFITAFNPIFQANAHAARLALQARPVAQHRPQQRQIAYRGPAVRRSKTRAGRVGVTSARTVTGGGSDAASTGSGRTQRLGGLDGFNYQRAMLALARNPAYKTEMRRLAPWFEKQGRTLGKQVILTVTSKVDQIRGVQAPPGKSWVDELTDPVLNPLIRGLRAEVEPHATAIAVKAGLGALAGALVMGAGFYLLGKRSGRRQIYRRATR